MRAHHLSLALTYGIAGLGVLAAVLHVTPAYGAVLAVFLAVGLYRDWTERNPLSGWMVNFVSVCGLIIALALPSGEGIIGRLLAASIVLMCGKLLGPKAPRDQMQIMLLSALLLVGTTILTLSLSFAVLFLVYLVLCTVALVWLPFGSALKGRQVERAFVKRVMLVAGGLVVGSLPLVVVFFVALPRTGSPYWRGVGPAAAAVSGFGEQVALGDLSHVARSDAVAFRAELRNAQGPLPEPPYWRGLTLEATDGITWARRPEIAEDPPYAPAPGSGGIQVSQRIYMEPHGLTTLFVLDRALGLQSAPIYLQATVVDGAVEARRSVGRRIRYDVVSDTSATNPVALGPLQREACLTIPAGAPRVVVTRAREIVGAEQDPRRKAALLLDHFHNDGYVYSLEPPPGSGHPLEVFLSETKTGYCEHFASAMALMLRSVGVPARLVVGYLGGDYNDTGNYYAVRQRSAHAWVEAYLEGEGWLRLDPTPPGQGPATTATEPPGRLSLLLDAARMRWQSLMMGYDLDEQLVMANAVTGGVGRGLSWRPGLHDLDDLAMLGLLVAAIVTAVVLIRRGRRGAPIDALYATMLRSLHRRGLSRAPTEGPLDFAARAGAGLPERRDLIHAVSEAYTRARYGGRAIPPDQVAKLRRLLRRQLRRL